MYIKCSCYYGSPFVEESVISKCKKNISNLQTKLKAVNGINPVHDVHSKQGGA